MNTNQRFFMLSFFVPLTLFVSFVLTWRLWISTRLYPMTPVIVALKSPPFPVDYALFFGLLIFLIVATSYRGKGQHTIFCICFCTILTLGLFDQMRWQPYIYQYTFLLGALIFFVSPKSETSRLSALHTCQIIVATTYFWSGVQKLNVSFMQKTVYWLFDPPIFSNYLFLVQYTWFLIPLFEIAIGAGLLFARTRKFALMGALSMHLFILFDLGLLKHNLLYVVWIWNACFALFCFILFCREQSSFHDIVIGNMNRYKGLVMALFMFAPILGIFHIIDSNLSAAFYSGNLMKATLFIDNSLVEIQSPEVRRHINSGFVDIYSWAYTDFGISLYSELRIFKSIAASFCEKRGDIQLSVLNKPYPWSTQRSTSFFSCKDL